MRIPRVLEDLRLGRRIRAHLMFYEGRRTRILFGVCLVACAAIAAFAVHSLSVAWKRDQCGQQLKRLGVDLRIFASKHEGRFPSSWSGLAPVGDLQNWLRQFQCPAGTHPKGDWDSVDAWADYRLVPGRSTNDPPDTVLATESAAYHGGKGRHVLYVRGHVEWRSVPP
jgi:hypothetical protein